MLRRRLGGGPNKVDVQVKQGDHDGYGTSDTAFNNDNVFVLAGADAADKSLNAFALFDPVNIPNGATIDVAYMVVTARHLGSTGNQNLDVSMEDADDPATPVNVGDLNGRVHTAKVAWDDEDFVIDVPENTPSIVTAIQTIVDRVGWASGQAMLGFIFDDDSGTDEFINLYSYDNDPNKVITLHVEWSS